MTTTAPPVPVVKVRVRDEAAEAAAWGSGPGGPIIREVVLPWVCRECGGPRGQVNGHRFVDDGVWATVDCWMNDCGHVDNYSACIAEAESHAAVDAAHAALEITQLVAGSPVRVIPPYADCTCPPAAGWGAAPAHLPDYSGCRFNALNRRADERTGR